MKQKIKDFFYEFKLLLSCVSPLLLALFILAIFAMNLLANKSLDLPFNWLALDCGIIVSWVAFLCMDILTKHYGPKASTQISILSIIINLLACLILFIASKISGTWGAFFDFGENQIINEALDSTIGGTWYVLLGSTIAFVSSAIINNFTNWGVGKLFKKKPNGFLSYIARSNISTAIGQFADNFIFALIVSHIFFGWSMLQCITCALTGMVVELLVEAIFTPLGFKVCQNWQKNNVGQTYLNYIANKKEGANK